MKKNLLFLFLICVFTLGCKQQPKSIAVSTTVPNEQTQSTENLTTVTFSINGMTCPMGCAASIEKKLQQTQGVKDAQVNFEKKTAVVEYDQKTLNNSQIKEIVEGLGDGNTFKTEGL